MTGEPRRQVLACIECEEEPRERGAWCGACWAALIRTFMDSTRPWN